MGGTVIDAGMREAASALRWWVEMGVDIAIQESPRNWFEPAGSAPAAAEPLQIEQVAALPETLEAFQAWLSTDPGAPLFSPRSKAVLPIGIAEPDVMILVEPPTRDELASGQPIAPEAAQLMDKMLAAIAMTDSFYIAGLSCFHSPEARLSTPEAQQCAAAARRHVALVRPKRLLLLGEAPCKALLGKRLTEARGHVHQVESVRTVASFHPRQLLKRSSDKALAWQDLLLLTEDNR